MEYSFYSTFFFFFFFFVVRNTHRIEACLSVNPPRVDIIKENINFYHGMILFKVNEFRDTDITSIKTNFALRMIDFLNVSCFLFSSHTSLFFWIDRCVYPIIL